MAFIPSRMSVVALITLITRIFAYQVAPSFSSILGKKTVSSFASGNVQETETGLSFCQQCGIAKETVSLISLSHCYLQLEGEKYPV